MCACLQFDGGHKNRNKVYSKSGEQAMKGTVTAMNEDGMVRQQPGEGTAFGSWYGIDSL